MKAIPLPIRFSSFSFLGQRRMKADPDTLQHPTPRAPYPPRNCKPLSPITGFHSPLPEPPVPPPAASLHCRSDLLANEELLVSGTAEDGHHLKPYPVWCSEDAMPVFAGLTACASNCTEASGLHTRDTSAPAGCRKHQTWFVSQLKPKVRAGISIQSGFPARAFIGIQAALSECLQGYIFFKGAVCQAVQLPAPREVPTVPDGRSGIRPEQPALSITP